MSLNDLTFLGIFNDSKKMTPRQKLEDAREAFAHKYGRPADVCLLSVSDADAIFGAEVPTDLHLEGRSYIPKNTFYLGEMPRGGTS